MNTNRDLSQYRIKKAKQELETAEILFQKGVFNTSANRSYYSIFHAIRALLALESIDFKKHSAVISHFRKEYVKKGVFDTVFSEIAGNAFNIRNSCDYEDFYLISKNEVKEQIENANMFIDAIEKYLKI
jgi:uncharacterized protein (UPF0332 family)